MDTTKKLPVYAKLSLITMGLIGFFYILYVGQDILVPLIFATIFAILLNPVVNFLCRKGMNRVVAIMIVLTTALVTVAALMYFIGSQVSMFSETVPQLKQKIALIFNDVIGISYSFNDK